MKILFVTTLSGKKINNFMLSSILAAKNINAEYHLACNTDVPGYESYNKECQKYGITLHHIDFDRRPFRLKNIKAYNQLKRIIAIENFDIVHVNTPVGGILGRLVAKKYKHPQIIYTAHGFHFYQSSSLLSWIFYHNLEKYMSKFTDLLITVNEEDYLVSKKMHAKQIMKINGVGFNKKEVDKLVDLHSIAGIDSKERIIISVGELNKNKNHKDVVKNLDKINAHYVIVGAGKEEKKLIKMAKSINCENKLKFLGYRTDVIDLLSSADLFVFPSKREGLSVALMEAMSVGLPCVVSDIRGNRDLIHHGKGGFLVKNHKDYSTYVNKILNDPVLMTGMGQYNKITSENFTLEKIVNVYTEIYRGIMVD